MQYMTFKNCNGDFSIMQFIYENEKIKAVLDFERAKYMPVGWEIIRSYTHIDEQCKDGSFNIKNYNSVAKVSKQNYAGIAKRLFFLHSYIEVNIISL